MLKVAAIISGSGWLLNALIEGCNKGNIDAEIALIISNENNELAIERVKQAGRSMLIINHEDYPDRETFDRKLHLVLQEYGIEFICLADFNRLLSPWFVEQWWNRVINCHPSLLPAFKGMRTCSRMLRAGVKFAGCTVHFVRTPMDAGPIIIQAVIPILPEDTPATLRVRIKGVEKGCFVQALQWIALNGVKVVDECVLVDGTEVPSEVLLSPGKKSTEN